MCLTLAQIQHYQETVFLLKEIIYLSGFLIKKTIYLLNLLIQIERLTYVHMC